MADRKESWSAYEAIVNSYKDNGFAEDNAGFLHKPERQTVFELVFQFLCTCRPDDRFRFPEFNSILFSSAPLESFDPGKASVAFCNIEYYLILVLASPWKREYQKIKKFGGFYQTKIASHLKNAESIFRLVGFVEDSGSVLVLPGAADTRILLAVAFECIVAAVECRVIERCMANLQNDRLTVVEVVNFRINNSGSPEDIVNKLHQKFGRSKKVFDSNVPDGGPFVDEASYTKPVPPPPCRGMPSSTTDQFRNKLQEHIKLVQKHSDSDTSENIPFIDEDSHKSPRENFKEGTLDDHLMASLQLMQQKEDQARPIEEIPPAVPASQEWSFVREGLEGKYGKKYFEGVRKDILQKDTGSSGISDENSYAKEIQPSPVLLANTDMKMKRKVASLVKPPDNLDAMGTDGSRYERVIHYPPNVTDNKGLSRSTGYFSNPQSMPVARKNSAPSEEVVERRPKFLQQTIATNAPVSRHSVTIPVSHPSSKQYSPVTQDSSNEGLDNIKSYMKKSLSPASAITQQRSPYVSHSAPVAVKPKMAVSGHPMGPRSVDLPNSSGWTCIHCTLINAIDNNICEVCNKSRDKLEVDAPDVGKTSKCCEKCTFENSLTATSCEACGGSLMSTHTVV